MRLDHPVPWLWGVRGMLFVADMCVGVESIGSTIGQRALAQTDTELADDQGVILRNGVKVIDQKVCQVEVFSRSLARGTLTGICGRIVTVDLFPNSKPFTEKFSDEGVAFV
jgi:hypothetical protein